MSWVKKNDKKFRFWILEKIQNTIEDKNKEKIEEKIENSFNFYLWNDEAEDYIREEIIEFLIKNNLFFKDIESFLDSSKKFEFFDNLLYENFQEKKQQEESLKEYLELAKNRENLKYLENDENISEIIEYIEYKFNKALDNDNFGDKNINKIKFRSKNNVFVIQIINSNDENREKEKSLLYFTHFSLMKKIKSNFFIQFYLDSENEVKFSSSNKNIFKNFKLEKNNFLLYSKERKKIFFNNISLFKYIFQYTYDKWKDSTTILINNVFEEIKENKCEKIEFSFIDNESEWNNQNKKKIEKSLIFNFYNERDNINFEELKKRIKMIKDEIPLEEDKKIFDDLIIQNNKVILNLGKNVLIRTILKFLNSRYNEINIMTNQTKSNIKNEYIKSIKRERENIIEKKSK